MSKIGTGLLSGATSGLVERDDNSMLGTAASMVGSGVRDLGTKLVLSRLGVPLKAADIGVDVASGAAEGAVAEGKTGAAVGAAGALLGRLIPGGEAVVGKAKKAVESNIRRKLTPEYSTAKKTAEAARKAAEDAGQELTGVPPPIGPLKIPQGGIAPTEEMLERDTLERMRREQRVAGLKSAADAAELKQQVTGLEMPVAQANKIKNANDMIDWIPGTIKSTLGSNGTIQALQMTLADPALVGIPFDQISFSQFTSALGRAVAKIVQESGESGRQYRINKVLGEMSAPKPAKKLPEAPRRELGPKY